MRIIGIDHRTGLDKDTMKKIPTKVTIWEDGKSTSYNLPDETAEKDWVFGVFPLRTREPREDDNLANFKGRFHQIKWEEISTDDLRIQKFSRLLRSDKTKLFVATALPADDDGLKSGDIVGLMLGGSGDRIAYALARKANALRAKVLGIPATALAEQKVRVAAETGQILETSELIVKLLVEGRDNLFYLMRQADYDLIELRETFRSRQDAMKARVATTLRLRQRYIGSIFCTPDAGYPEGEIEMHFEDVKANSKILQSHLDEEKELTKKIENILERIPIFHVLTEIKGIGPRIAAGIISGITDIRRFSKHSKLEKYAGVHVNPDGTFPKRKRGQNCEYTPELRQTLYLLADQFIRRKDSYWGKKLIEAKARFRVKHPEPITIEREEIKTVKGQEVVVRKKATLYSNGHIHKMGIWRTLTYFVRALHKAWWRIEKGADPKTVSLVGGGANVFQAGA